MELKGVEPLKLTKKGLRTTFYFKYLGVNDGR